MIGLIAMEIVFHELALGENGITRSVIFHRDIFRGGIRRDTKLRHQEIEGFVTNLLVSFWYHQAILEFALISPDDDTIEELANYYKVSRPVHLIEELTKVSLHGKITGRR